MSNFYPHARLTPRERWIVTVGAAASLFWIGAALFSLFTGLVWLAVRVPGVLP